MLDGHGAMADRRRSTGNETDAQGGYPQTPPQIHKYSFFKMNTFNEKKIKYLQRAKIQKVMIIII